METIRPDRKSFKLVREIPVGQERILFITKEAEGNRDKDICTFDSMPGETIRYVGIEREGTPASINPKILDLVASQRPGSSTREVRDDPWVGVQIENLIRQILANGGKYV